MNKKLVALLFCLIPFSVFSWDKEDFKAEVASPVTTDARKVLIYGSALTLGAALFQHEIGDHIQKDMVKHKPFGDYSKYGDLMGQLVPNAAYVLGQAIAGYSGSGQGYARALGMFKATAYASGVTTVIKYSVREPRPNNHQDRNSFPSGHSTTAFAFAGYVLEEHGWAWGAPSLALAGFVGASRINDNKHRLHDVLAGGTIGLAYGIGIAKIQKKKGETMGYFSPIVDRSTQGVAWYREF